MTDVLLAIDPGDTESGYVILDRMHWISEHGIVSNEDMRTLVQRWLHHLAIESVTSYGMAVGQSVFETIWWAGRFYEAAAQASRVERVTRSEVKHWLCHSTAAKDTNVNQRLLDLWGPKGTKAHPGPTYGMAKHKWAALGVAATVRRIENPLDFSDVLSPSGIVR